MIITFMMRILWGVFYILLYTSLGVPISEVIYDDLKEIPLLHTEKSGVFDPSTLFLPSWANPSNYQFNYLTDISNCSVVILRSFDNGGSLEDITQTLLKRYTYAHESTCLVELRCKDSNELSMQCSFPHFWRYIALYMLLRDIYFERANFVTHILYIDTDAFITDFSKSIPQLISEHLHIEDHMLIATDFSCFKSFVPINNGVLLFQTATEESKQWVRDLALTTINSREKFNELRVKNLFYSRGLVDQPILTHVLYEKGLFSHLSEISQYCLELRDSFRRDSISKLHAIQYPANKTMISNTHDIKNFTYSNSIYETPKVTPFDLFKIVSPYSSISNTLVVPNSLSQVFPKSVAFHDFWVGTVYKEVFKFEMNPFNLTLMNTKRTNSKHMKIQWESTVSIYKYYYLPIFLGIKNWRHDSTYTCPFLEEFKSTCPLAGFLFEDDFDSYVLYSSVPVDDTNYLPDDTWDAIKPIRYNEMLKSWRSSQKLAETAYDSHPLPATSEVMVRRHGIGIIMGVVMNGGVRRNGGDVPGSQWRWDKSFIAHVSGMDTRTRFSFFRNICELLTSKGKHTVCNGDDDLLPLESIFVRDEEYFSLMSIALHDQIVTAAAVVAKAPPVMKKVNEDLKKLLPSIMNFQGSVTQKFGRLLDVLHSASMFASPLNLMFARQIILNNQSPSIALMVLPPSSSYKQFDNEFSRTFDESHVLTRNYNFNISQQLYSEFHNKIANGEKKLILATDVISGAPFLKPLHSLPRWWFDSSAHDSLLYKNQMTSLSSSPSTSSFLKSTKLFSLSTVLLSSGYLLNKYSYLEKNDDSSSCNKIKLLNTISLFINNHTHHNFITVRNKCYDQQYNVHHHPVDFNDLYNVVGNIGPGDHHSPSNSFSSVPHASPFSTFHLHAKIELNNITNHSYFPTSNTTDNNNMNFDATVNLTNKQKFHVIRSPELPADSAIPQQESYLPFKLGNELLPPISGLFSNDPNFAFILDRFAFEHIRNPLNNKGNQLFTEKRTLHTSHTNYSNSTYNNVIQSNKPSIGSMLNDGSLFEFLHPSKLYRSLANSFPNQLLDISEKSSIISNISMPPPADSLNPSSSVSVPSHIHLGSFTPLNSIDPILRAKDMNTKTKAKTKQVRNEETSDIDLNEDEVNWLNTFGMNHPFYTSSDVSSQKDQIQIPYEGGSQILNKFFNYSSTLSQSVSSTKATNDTFIEPSNNVQQPIVNKNKSSYLIEEKLGSHFNRQGDSIHLDVDVPSSNLKRFLFHSSSLPLYLTLGDVSKASDIVKHKLDNIFNLSSTENHSNNSSKIAWIESTILGISGEHLLILLENAEFVLSKLKKLREHVNLKTLKMFDECSSPIDNHT